MVKYNILGYFFLIILLIAISLPSPFLVFLISFFFLLSRRIVKVRSLIVIAVLSSILLGALNTSKVPENDLITYLDLYHMSKDMSLIEYLWSNSITSGVESLKEPFYPIIVWFLNRICFDNELLFKFSFSFVTYFILNISVLIFGLENKIESRYILFGIFMMTFFPLIFTISLHAMRQFIAGAFIMIVLSLRCFTTIKIWILILLSVLMVLLHTTSIFFFPFIFLKAFERKWTDAKIWYGGILAALILIRVLAVFFLGYIGLNENSGIAGYALSRAAQETGYDVEAISSIGIVFVLFILGYSFYLLFHKINNDNGLRRFYNIPFFVGIFILLNLQHKELALRFLFYLYFFFPFVAMYYVYLRRMNSRQIMLLSIPLIMLFLYYLEFGTWTYDIPFTVIFSPLPLYFV